MPDATSRVRPSDAGSRARPSAPRTRPSAPGRTGPSLSPLRGTSEGSPRAAVCGRDEGPDLDRCAVVVVHPETVREVRARLATAATTEQMAAVFKVLADPSRCRLVAALIAAGEICVCDLAATVGMSESSVSHHLRVLRASRLVRARREGRMIYYAPDDEHIAQLLDITREHVAHEAPADAEGPAPDGASGAAAPGRAETS